MTMMIFLPFSKRSSIRPKSWAISLVRTAIGLSTSAASLAVANKPTARHHIAVFAHERYGSACSATRRLRHAAAVVGHREVVDPAEHRAHRPERLELGDPRWRHAQARAFRFTHRSRGSCARAAGVRPAGCVDARSGRQPRRLAKTRQGADDPAPAELLGDLEQALSAAGALVRVVDEVLDRRREGVGIAGRHDARRGRARPRAPRTRRPRCRRSAARSTGSRACACGTTAASRGGRDAC